MTIAFIYNGSDLGTSVVRLGAISSGLQSRAEGGALGTGGIPLDDPSGSLTITGLRPFYVTEAACTTAPRLWTGYLMDRHIGRGQTGPTDSLRTGAARRYEGNLVDLNAIPSFLLYTAATANRPAETVDARVAWLMASTQMALVTGPTTWIDSSSAVMSATDYRGNYPQAVLSAIVNLTGWDTYIFYDQTSASPTLFLGDPNGATRLSTLSISNVLADQTSTCLYPLYDADLWRDPARVYSGVYLQWQGGNTYEYDATTAANFIARDIAVSESGVGRAATAVAEAEQYLASSSTEFDRLQCTLKIPASQVNLVDAGMRINAKFTHLPGYESGKNMRVALRSVMASEQTDQFYNVYLELITPIQTNYSWFGNGRVPDLGPTKPPTTPACLTSLGTIGFSEFVGSGPFPHQPCVPINHTVGSRLYCSDNGVGNPCYGGFGSTGTLFWGSTIAYEAFISDSAVTIPTGAVLARFSADVSTDPGPYGTAGAHGWKVYVMDHPPTTFYDGQEVIQSLVADAIVYGDAPPNALTDGVSWYAMEVPAWQEQERRVCGVSTVPWPGGDYGAGAVGVEFFGFCDGTIGLAPWVGGVGLVDGSNATFELVSWDGTGVPQAKVNGLPTPVTAAFPDVVFQDAPPAGAFVTFQYNVRA